MKLDIQPCLKSCLYLKHLCLSKQPTTPLIAPVSEDVPIPVSAPKGITLAHRFRLTGSQIFRHKLLIVCKYMQSCGATSFVSPSGHHSQAIWRCLAVVIVTCLQTNTESLFRVIPSKLEQHSGKAKMVVLLRALR